LPERPSSKLTWIEYSPFFIVFPTRPSRVAERRTHSAKPGATASTRQVGRWCRAARNGFEIPSGDMSVR
jgi:hypothetical protein